jgi:hypothetical protein
MLYMDVREYHRSGESVCKLLERIFRPKEEKIAVGCKRVHNQILNLNFFNIIMVVKSETQWMEKRASTREKQEIFANICVHKHSSYGTGFCSGLGLHSRVNAQMAGLMDTCVRASTCEWIM